MTDTHIPDIGDLAVCCNCYEEKKISQRVTEKKHNEPAVITWYCEDCYNGVCFCHICVGETTYDSYEKHLLDNHTPQELAHELLAQKMSAEHR